MKTKVVCANALVLAAGALASLPAAWADSFDNPLEVSSAVQAEGAEESEGGSSVKCFFFKTFMVKRVSKAENPDSLSVVSISEGKPKPACATTRVPGEKRVSIGRSFFEGVKGDYVFVTSEKPTNGTLPFEVLDAKSAKSVFKSNISLGSTATVRNLLGSRLDLKVRDGSIGMSWTTGVKFSCSLRTDAKCWQTETQNFPWLGQDVPDCKLGYKINGQVKAKAGCKDSEDPKCTANAMKAKDLAKDPALDALPSMVSVPVEVASLAAPQITRRARAEKCWPVDGGAASPGVGLDAVYDEE